MKAIVRDTYGSPDVLKLREIEKPELTDDGVLVRVHAASVARGDWYTLTGLYVGRAEMGLRKPKSRLIGGDFAGTIEAVGRDVTGFTRVTRCSAGGAALSRDTCALARAPSP
jgi:NADPH:quinone reductase-like Zn-dependent oxidoreductase